MARIMCTQTLWRRLGNQGKALEHVDEPLLHAVVLGNWAAKIFKWDGRDLVLAVNERTSLRLVFPFAPGDQFRTNFAAALRGALEDLRIPRPIVASEVDAIQVEPLARLTDDSMATALNDLQYLCEVDHLQYHADLRVVQLNLNEYPHPTGPPDPIAAVRGLLRGVRRRAALTH